MSVLYIIICLMGSNKAILNLESWWRHQWKHFPRYWPFVWGIHRSPVNSLHKDQWWGAWMFSLICVWINGWENNREAGDLRSHRAHYDVTVMRTLNLPCCVCSQPDNLGKLAGSMEADHVAVNSVDVSVDVNLLWYQKYGWDASFNHQVKLKFIPSFRAFAPHLSCPNCQARRRPFLRHIVTVGELRSTLCTILSVPRRFLDVR